MEKEKVEESKRARDEEVNLFGSTTRLSLPSSLSHIFSLVIFHLLGDLNVDN